jgi:beta-glucanase (GH16 family)
MTVTRTPERWRLLAAAFAVAVAAASPFGTAVTAKAVGPAAPGWDVVFVDDFEGPAGSGVDPGVWQYTTGTQYPGGPAGFGTGEVETMTDNPANVSLDGNGNLRITPLRDAAGSWTSGRIETKRADLQAPSGGALRVEGRLRLPDVTGTAARGYWPAFWMLGEPYRGNWWNWPSVGEIDIMENVQGINNVWATLHCGTSPGGPCGEKVGIGGQRACAPISCQAGFHTYTMEWDRSATPETLKWFLDGVHFHTVRADQVDAATWAAATHHGFFIILNVAIGGEFPDALGGGPDAATSPGAAMVVDYVGAWRRG